MSWYTDVSTWAKKPPAIQVYNDQGESVDYLPERTCQRVFWQSGRMLVCSECGAGMTKALDRYCFLNYCPNCGAKIEKESWWSE